MKKLLSILIAIALMLSLSVTVFAEETGNLSITRGGVTEYFDYIVEAFEAAEDGDAIKVEQDYIEEEDILYYWDDEAIKTITIDLNGKEIHFPEGYLCAADHGYMNIVSANVIFTDTVGGGIIHALVAPYENAVVKGGTYRGFWPLGDVTVEGGTFLGLPQEIVDNVDVWDDTEKELIGTKGLLLTTYDRVFLTEDAAREALDAIIADGYTADKPYDITPYEMDGETRYSAGFAAGTSIVKTDSKSTTVTYSVAPAYTVTIPETVTIGADGTSATVSAEDVVVNKGQYVSVTLAADNNFTVKTAEGAVLAYTVTANGEAVAPGGEILAVNPADGKTGTATITFDIDESAIKYAGTYTGSATFTIAVKDVPLINFTTHDSWRQMTSSYQAEEGMTWGEWVTSSYNTGGYTVQHYDDLGDIIRYGYGVIAILVEDGYVYPSPEDVILADQEYILPNFQ